MIVSRHHTWQHQCFQYDTDTGNVRSNENEPSLEQWMLVNSSPPVEQPCEYSNSIQITALVECNRDCVKCWILMRQTTGCLFHIDLSIDRKSIDFKDHILSRIARCCSTFHSLLIGRKRPALKAFRFNNVFPWNAQNTCATVLPKCIPGLLKGTKK